jgi:hypothetical protein
MAQTWIEYLAEYRKKNPDVKGRQVMKEASVVWKASKVGTKTEAKVIEPKVKKVKATKPKVVKQNKDVDVAVDDVKPEEQGSKQNNVV